MPGARQTTGKKWGVLVLALALLGLTACTADKKAEEERRREIQGLKTEIKVLQDKVAQLEAAQQTLQIKTAQLEAGNLEIQKQLAKPEPAATPPAPTPPAAPPPLTVSQLLREKERFQGTRITVQGLPGTVLVHHKTLLLRAPEGVVEVYYGRLPEVKTINRLSSTTLDQPLTVTGIFNFPAKTGGNPRITAEAVEF